MKDALLRGQLAGVGVSKPSRLHQHPACCIQHGIQRLVQTLSD